ncbi:TetR/AcrR family transcriptional regulator [Rhodococcus oryzae]|uniref:TetR/AcrR family transcriptional regulator n=1 Tax=Rhodococcus oryzae TaxID=2571143 RepID=A0ABY2RPT9_9NOCA|nr:TetR/AcrR family transcriptional regulator [Rhodococcus oryzae]
MSEVERHYGGRPVTARKAERRSQFLGAALAVFTEKGYARSSVADICAAAGLARSQFYAEFASREDLLLALYDQIQSDARDAMVAGLAEVDSADVREHAAAAMAAFVESIGQDPRRAQISYVDIVGVSPRVEQHRLDQRAVWRGFFESTLRGVAGAGFVPPGGYEMASTAFIGALTALVHQWSTTDPRPPVAGLIDVMTTVLNAFVSGASEDSAET